jgi:glycosyltransferase involved in cell wall biosynthesis
MSLLYLRDQIAWFGSHTGYEQLTRFMAKETKSSVVGRRGGQLTRYLGSSYARLQGRSGRGATDFSEVEFRFRRNLQRPRLSHILYLEDHLNLINAWKRRPGNVIGTIHLPASVWRPEQCKSLSRLTAALVLYHRDIAFFEKHVGKERVKFIHHGADLEFFKPDITKLLTPPRILYSGVFLRNEPMLVRLVNQLLEEIPQLRFDLLIPLHHRKSPNLAPLLNHPAVTWHAGLNDEELRELYQKSYLMLLPMNDSGANTAVVEALACGLPIATTDVGGIRDYAGGDILKVVANNDDRAMVELIAEYVTKPALRNEVAQQCRQFAEANLAWPLVARKHIAAYEEILA